MNKLLPVLLLLTAISTNAQKEWKAVSPDKALQIVLKTTGDRLFYTVSAEGVEIIRPSALGLKAEGVDFAGGLSFVRSSAKKITERYTLAVGKRKVNVANTNETSVVFKNRNGALLQIDLRAYNDGVAFRYAFPGSGKRLTITNEYTAFALSGGGKAWMQNYDLPTDYTPAYEGVYEDRIPIGTSAKDSGGWALPALFQTKEHWLLITEANLDKNYFGVHLKPDCSDAVYKMALPLAGEGKGVGSTVATAVTPFATPWRVLMIGKNVGAIIESNLVHHLATPNKIGDVSWVKPGRASWSWWGDHESSRDFEKLKKFVDLAREMGWEYSLVDANWNVMKGGDIKQLVDYANAQNIGLLFWYNSGGPHNVVTEQPRDIMNDPVKRKEEFRRLHQWGVKGVKIDFFQSDKQNIIQLYHDILTDAAKEKIMVNFHGCTLPRGWSRTYPHLVSMEAVRGAENYGWGKEFAQTAPVLNNIYTYTRNVVGPMDYTPVTFTGYDCCPHVTTNAHELALSVLFETGILHFADRAEPYRNLDGRIKDFMRFVPTVWDDTKFIQGEPGRETILARRSGNTWYVAGANAENLQKALSLRLPFLTATNYGVTVFSDGNSARDIKVSDLNLKKNETLDVNVLPKGGFVAVLTPVGGA